MKRVERFVSGGCLLFLVTFLVIGVGPAIAVWYALAGTDTANARNRADAEAELHDQVQRAARESTRALGASVGDDPAALTALIARHTEAPVITYDAVRGEFTALVEKAAFYQSAGILGGGADRITSCDLFTYVLGPDLVWRVDVARQDASACLPGEQIGALAREAARDLQDVEDDLTTVAQAQRALDRTRSLGRPDVRKVVHDGGTTTVTAVLSDPARTVDQCYLLTVPRPGSRAPAPVTATGTATATPTSACPPASVRRGGAAEGASVGEG